MQNHKAGAIGQKIASRFCGRTKRQTAIAFAFNRRVVIDLLTEARALRAIGNRETIFTLIDA